MDSAAFFFSLRASSLGSPASPGHVPTSLDGTRTSERLSRSYGPASCGTIPRIMLDRAGRRQTDGPRCVGAKPHDERFTTERSSPDRTDGAGGRPCSTHGS